LKREGEREKDKRNLHGGAIEALKSDENC